MKVFWIEDWHSRMYGSYGEYFIVQAETKKEAQEKAEKVCSGKITIEEIDISEPYLVKETD